MDIVVSIEDSLNKIKERVLLGCSHSAAHEEAKYIFDNQGKSLDELAQSYLKKGFSERRLTIIVSSFQSVIGTLIAEENIPNLVKKSREEIIQKAIDKNITLNKSYIKHHGEDNKQREQYQWLGRILDLQKVDKSERLKQRLKWINCLTEFYCGQPLFVEISTQENNINTSTKMCEKLSEFENNKNHLIEENFVKRLLQEGYLQCDLNR